MKISGLRPPDKTKGNENSKPRNALQAESRLLSEIVHLILLPFIFMIYQGKIFSWHFMIGEETICSGRRCCVGREIKFKRLLFLTGNKFLPIVSKNGVDEIT